MKLFSVEFEIMDDVLEKERWEEVDDGWVYILRIEGIEKYPDSFIEFDRNVDIDDIEIQGYENELELFCEERPQVDIPIRIFVANWGGINYDMGRGFNVK